MESGAPDDMSKLVRSYLGHRCRRSNESICIWVYRNAYAVEIFYLYTVGAELSLDIYKIYMCDYKCHMRTEVLSADDHNVICEDIHSEDNENIISGRCPFCNTSPPLNIP